MIRSLHVSILRCILAFGASFWIGYILQGQSSRHQVVDAATWSASGRNHGGSAPRSQSAELSRRPLKDSRDMPTAETVLSELNLLREKGVDPISKAKALLLIVDGGRLCPEKTYAFLMESKSENFTTMGMPTLFSVWAATNEPGAIKFISQMKNVGERDTAEMRLLLALAQNVPRHALDVIRNNPKIDFSKGANASNVFFEAFYALGAKAFPDAMGEIDKLTDPMQKSLAMRGVAAAAVKEDLGTAIDWCGDALIDEGVKKQLMEFMFRRAILVDPSHALTELESRVESGAIDLELAATSISGNRKELLNCNFDSACGMVLTLCERDRQYSPLLLKLLEDYSKSAPSEATGKLEELLQRESERLEKLGGPFLEACQTLTTRILLKEHPERYASALEDMNLENHEILSGLFSELFRHNGEAFADYLMRCSEDRLDSDARQQYLQDWMGKDTEQAYSWVTTNLPDGEDRDKLQFVYDRRRMDQNKPEYMAKMAGAEDSESNRKLVRILANQLGRSEAQETATWALSLKSPDLRIEAVDAVSKEWIRRDSFEASAWITSMPPGEERIIAVRDLVEAIRQVDPVNAKSWEEELK